jgi:undecaprenyl-diphosphatase
MSLSFVPLESLLGVANPLSGVDHELAGWFHAHLSHPLVAVLRGLSELGDSEWIGMILAGLVVFFALNRSWPSLFRLIVAVPGGMLLNEWVKVLVHRHRPFVNGWFVDWSGYSFASGHTIGATLLYGQLVLFLIPILKTRSSRAATVFTACFFVLLVGFSRIALGAHYLTDVLAAICFGMIWLSICLYFSKWWSRNSVVPADPMENSVLARTETLQPIPIAPNE